MERCVSIKLRPLNTYRAVCSLCLYICLLAGCLPIAALFHLSVCRPHLLVCSAAFQPLCLGLLLTGDKRACWRPSVTPALSVLLCSSQLSAAGLSQSGVSHEAHSNPPPSNKQTNKDFPCWFHYEAKRTLRTRAALKDAGADWCRAHHVIIDNNDNRACEKQFMQWRKMQKAAGEGAWGC